MNRGKSFFYDTNAFKTDPTEKEAHNKLIFILKKLIAEKGHAFSLALIECCLIFFSHPYKYKSPNTKNGTFLENYLEFRNKF